MEDSKMKRENSLALQEKAVKIIPGMTQLLSKRPDMYSRGIWPSYFKNAKGIYVTDLDDNTYRDFSIGGVGATVLGYADDEVNAAVIEVIHAGSATTLNGPEEVALAEKLLELHPWADMARFARAGGEAMALAVRIARTATKKDVVVFCGYHGWMDWYLAANLGGKDALGDHWIAGLSPNGVPVGLKGTAIPFKFNNTDSFREAIEKAGDNLAAVVMEPIRNFYPETSFIESIHQTVTNKGVPLVLDEISAGFRICNGGAHLELGWKPDIAVFSKALGNGFPSSAIIGKEWVMNAAQEAFITSTNWTERVGATAALAMINKFVSVNASKHLIEISDLVWKGWEKLSQKYKIPLNIGGFRPMIHLHFGENHRILCAYFIQEMLKKRFLASAGFYAMYAHTTGDVEDYLNAVEEVFAQLSYLIAENKVEQMLEGEPCGIGFARIN